MSLLRGFKNFLMQGDLVVVAVGLVIALGFSTLIKAFTDNVITPLVNAAGGGGTTGVGVRINGQLIDFGAVISALIYFATFMAVVYFADRRSRPRLSAPPRHHRLRGAGAGEEVSPLPLGRHSRGGEQVQALRQ